VSSPNRAALGDLFGTYLITAQKNDNALYRRWRKSKAKGVVRYEIRTSGWGWPNLSGTFYSRGYPAGGPLKPGFGLSGVVHMSQT